jgi:hypothetical protein
MMVIEEKPAIEFIGAQLGLDGLNVWHRLVLFSCKSFSAALNYLQCEIRRLFLRTDSNSRDGCLQTFVDSGRWLVTTR